MGTFVLEAKVALAQPAIPLEYKLPCLSAATERDSK